MTECKKEDFKSSRELLLFRNSKEQLSKAEFELCVNKSCKKKSGKALLRVITKRLLNSSLLGGLDTCDKYIDYSFYNDRLNYSLIKDGEKSSEEIFGYIYHFVIKDEKLRSDILEEKGKIMSWINYAIENLDNLRLYMACQVLVLLVKGKDIEQDDIKKYIKILFYLAYSAEKDEKIFNYEEEEIFSPKTREREISFSLKEEIRKRIDKIFYTYPNDLQGIRQRILIGYLSKYQEEYHLTRDESIFIFDEIKKLSKNEGEVSNEILVSSGKTFFDNFKIEKLDDIDANFREVEVLEENSEILDNLKVSEFYGDLSEVEKQIVELICKSVMLFVEGTYQKILLKTFKIYKSLKKIVNIHIKNSKIVNEEYILSVYRLFSMLFIVNDDDEVSEKISKTVLLPFYSKEEEDILSTFEIKDENKGIVQKFLNSKYKTIEEFIENKKRKRIKFISDIYIFIEQFKDILKDKEFSILGGTNDIDDYKKYLKNENNIKDNFRLSHSLTTAIIENIRKYIELFKSKNKKNLSDELRVICFLFKHSLNIFLENFELYNLFSNYYENMINIETRFDKYEKKSFKYANQIVRIEDNDEKLFISIVFPHYMKSVFGKKFDIEYWSRLYKETYSKLRAPFLYRIYLFRFITDNLMDRINYQDIISISVFDDDRNLLKNMMKLNVLDSDFFSDEDLDIFYKYYMYHRKSHDKIFLFFMQFFSIIREHIIKDKDIQSVIFVSVLYEDYIYLSNFIFRLNGSIEREETPSRRESVEREETLPLPTNELLTNFLNLNGITDEIPTIPGEMYKPLMFILKHEPYLTRATYDRLRLLFIEYDIYIPRDGSLEEGQYYLDRGLHNKDDERRSIQGIQDKTILDFYKMRILENNTKLSDIFDIFMFLYFDQVKDLPCSDEFPNLHGIYDSDINEQLYHVFHNFQKIDMKKSEFYVSCDELNSVLNKFYYYEPTGYRLLSNNFHKSTDTLLEKYLLTRNISNRVIEAMKSVGRFYFDSERDDMIIDFSILNSFYNKRFVDSLNRSGDQDLIRLLQDEGRNMEIIEKLLLTYRGRKNESKIKSITIEKDFSLRLLCSVIGDLIIKFSFLDFFGFLQEENLKKEMSSIIDQSLKDISDIKFMYLSDFDELIKILKSQGNIESDIMDFYNNKTT